MSDVAVIPWFLVKIRHSFTITDLSYPSEALLINLFYTSSGFSTRHGGFYPSLGSSTRHGVLLSLQGLLPWWDLIFSSLKKLFLTPT